MDCSSSRRAWAAYALQGRITEGRALLEETVSKDIIRRCQRHVWLSEVFRLAGHGEEAWQHARQALDCARQLKELNTEARAAPAWRPPYPRHPPPDVAPAEEHYQQALALAEKLGMRPLVAHCHRGLGTLYATTGQREHARTELSAAIDLYQAMEMTFWLPQTEAVLAQVER
jgi:tetratricopeptide (TPR) repeat protein